MDDTQQARDEAEHARQLHNSVGLIGLRAQATAVGFLQLCGELLRAGAIDDAAVDRIKDAIAKEILVSRTTVRGQEEFEGSLRRRLDNIFPKSDDQEGRSTHVGPPEDLESALKA